MMAFSELLAAVRSQFGGSGWNPLARAVWCRKQRLHLAVPGHAVVWVRGATLPWAEWGARRGYFEVQRMDGLSYLRAIGAPTT